MLLGKTASTNDTELLVSAEPDPRLGQIVGEIARTPHTKTRLAATGCAPAHALDRLSAHPLTPACPLAARRAIPLVRAPPPARRSTCGPLASLPSSRTRRCALRVPPLRSLWRDPPLKPSGWGGSGAPMARLGDLLGSRPLASTFAMAEGRDPLAIWRR